VAAEITNTCGLCRQLAKPVKYDSAMGVWICGECLPFIQTAELVMAAETSGPVTFTKSKKELDNQ